MAERKNRKMSSGCQATLDQIVHYQKQIFNEVRWIRKRQDLAIQSAKMVRETINKQVSEIKDICSADVRSVETKVLGLTVVLDNVQDRIIQMELNEYGYKKNCLSTSSLYSTDEESGETIFNSELSSTGGMKTDHTRSDQTCKLYEEKAHNLKKWLQENHLLLVKGIDPTSCLLLDYLLQDNIISESDEDEISSHPTRKDKTRALLSKMRHAENEKIAIFVKHLQKDFPHLVQNLSRDDETGEDIERGVCIVCDVVKQINVDDAVDVLYQHDIVDDDLYEQIWRSSPNKKGWKRLLKNMDHIRMAKSLSVLTQALWKKYPGLCQRITQSGISSLICCCPKRKANFVSSDVTGETASYKVHSRLHNARQRLSCRSKAFTELYRLYCRSH